MRKIWAAACFAAYLLVGLANAADQAQEEATAKGKAQVLEQKASAEGSKTLPTATESITKSQAHAVDSTGQEPLDDAITCLARTIILGLGGQSQGQYRDGSYRPGRHASARAYRLSKHHLWSRQAGPRAGCLPVFAVVRWPSG
jgi:hypothetical protein